MKKTVAFRCDNAMDVRHAASFFSRVATMATADFENASIMDILLQLDEWSNDQELLPKELKEQGEEVQKKRREMLQSLNNGQLDSDEFNERAGNILLAENLVIDKILENEDIYPCVGIMLVDSELPKEQMFRFALQTAETAGYELVEKLPDVNQGITDMWQCVWETEPDLFMDLAFIAAQHVECMGEELLAIMKRILDNEILPKGMSREKFNTKFKKFFLFLRDEFLDFFCHAQGADDSDDKD